MPNPGPQKRAPRVFDVPWVRHSWLLGVGIVLSTVVGSAILKLRWVAEEERIHSRYTEHGEWQKRVTTAISSSSGGFQDLPSELTLEGIKEPLIVQYALDSSLQKAMENLFKDYKPDYGAFVAIDAVTGRVLALVSYDGPGRKYRGPNGQNHLALRASFPSASVFKVVTAAAAIAEKSFSADTVIPYNGRNHTLYRSNVLKENYNRWTRYITLKEAFARSVNSVFGKIGVFVLSPESLRDYAGRFGFNRRIAGEIPAEEGTAKISEDQWEIAEAASGFTKDNRMSPLQGALIAASIVNEGVMMEPWIVGSLHQQDGTKVYEALPQVATETVSSTTAREMRELMRETVKRGTSRGSFRRFGRGLEEIEVGGKTGSLTGDDPKGKYDWFVGYADNGPSRIAVAALTVHEKYWRVKSSYLARRAFEHYFRSP